MENKTEERLFEIEDIEDARIIIQVKGKHYSIISTGDKEDARAYRVALVQALLSMEGMIIVTPSLEEIKTNVQHGINCRKVQHDSVDRYGYLHSPTDDNPYLVDGVKYCGRCHEYLSSQSVAKDLKS